MRRLSALLIAAIAAPLAAQPSQATLEALGLRTEWVSAVPLGGGKDGIAKIQVADNRQIFVQTRGGLLAAFDATTGERLWSFHYATPLNQPLDLGWNDRLVFALNVTKLHGIQRLTGIVEFTTDLALAPTTGPVADADNVYVVMAGNRMAAMALPKLVTMPDPGAIARSGTPGAPKLANPADVVAGRYPGTSRAINENDDRFENRKISLTAEPVGSFGMYQRTASMAVVAQLRPPYRAFDDGGNYLNSTPSVGLVASLRQPYHLLDPTSKNAQRSPSISVIPPSLYSLHESASLRTKGVELSTRWTFGSTVPLAHTPVLTKNRLWGLTSTPVVIAVDRSNGKVVLDAKLSGTPAAGAAQALDIAYLPQQDGYLIAVDLDGGAFYEARQLWKANVGGLMNARPVVTGNAVWQAGTNAGIARVDTRGGEVLWRTERGADRLVAVNEEHLYARDIHGKLYVYDRNRVNDASSKAAFPVAGADLGRFEHAAVNSQTDRLYLASDTGMFICLRDANPKYYRPVTMAPPKHKQPPSWFE